MVKEFTILSIPVEPGKSVLDVLEGLWKSKRSRRSRWNGQRMRRCLLFGFQYYQKTCPVPNGATIGFSSFWLQGNNLGSITSFGVFTLTGICENLVSCFPLWNSFHRWDDECRLWSRDRLPPFCIYPPCSRPKLIASRTKSAEKSIYEIKKRIYEKDPLNCWYSIQNRRKQNRITKSKQTFFDFFLKTGVTFPFFSSLIYETRLVAVAERHTRSDCGLYLLDTIYICIKFIGAPIVVPLFACMLGMSLF